MLNPRYLALGVILILNNIPCYSKNTSLLDNAISLRQHVVVNSPILYLGDLFDGLDQQRRSIPLGRSPDPGKTIIWYSGTLKKIGERFQLLQALSTQSLPKIQISRTGHSLPSPLLLKALKQKLRRYVLCPKEGRVKIVLDQKGICAPFPANTSTKIRIEQVTFNPKTRRFRALVTFPKNQKTVLTVQGKVLVKEKAVTLKRFIPHGELIQPDDTQYTFVERSPSLKGMETCATDVHRCRVLKRTGLYPGEAIRSQDISPPGGIKSGQKVLVIFQTKNMKISLQAHALESGRNGRMIRVLNPQTKRKLDGIVHNGVVYVSPNE